MTHLRLMPIVILAVSSLFLLKVAGLVGGGYYSLGAIAALNAQEVLPKPSVSVSNENRIHETQGVVDDMPPELPKTPIEIAQDIVLGSAQKLQEAQSSPGQQELVNSLIARREEIEARASELEQRLALIEAAEARLQERYDALAELEQKIGSTADEKEAGDSAQMRGIIAMYEAMRPADAANIFNNLEKSVLLRVGRGMNPRKLGPIMAKMLPQKAQDLTTMLAKNENDDAMAVSSGRYDHLPQIMSDTQN